MSSWKSCPSPSCRLSWPISRSSWCHHVWEPSARLTPASFNNSEYNHVPGKVSQGTAHIITSTAKGKSHFPSDFSFFSRWEQSWRHPHHRNIHTNQAAFYQHYSSELQDTSVFIPWSGTENQKEKKSQFFLIQIWGPRWENEYARHWWLFHLRLIWAALACLTWSSSRASLQSWPFSHLTLKNAL